VKGAQIILLLLGTVGTASAQLATAPANGSFTESVDALRNTMLKLSSEHKLTAATGEVFQYNISIIEVSGNPSTCIVTWKDRIDLGSLIQTHTVSVNTRSIQKVLAFSSAKSKMGVDPAIEVVQVHTYPDSPLATTTESFNPDGSTRGTPVTTQSSVAHIFTNSEPEATAVIKRLTDTMTSCAP
jgi:hypothetical protein